MRWGWSAPTPSSFLRYSSYSEKLPSNQRTWLSPSNASTWVAIAVEEPAIVRDHHGAAGERFEPGFERTQRVDVEVVGRLVEQQHVAAGLEQLGEVQPVALATGQVADALAVVGALEVEARHVGAAVDLAAADLEHLGAAGDLVEHGGVGVEVVAVLVDVRQVDGVADLDRAGVGLARGRRAS